MASCPCRCGDLVRIIGNNSVKGLLAPSLRGLTGGDSGMPLFNSPYVRECVWPRLGWGVSYLNNGARTARFKPGQTVPHTGVYKIYHSRHHLMHEATFIEQTRFPRCKKCTNAVRFVLSRSIRAKYVLPFRSTELLKEWKRRSPRTS